MSVLAEFFQGSERHLGVFYPIGHIVAVFRDLKTAQAAARRLLDAGAPSSEVVAVPGDDFVQLASEHVKKESLFALFMQEVSRLIETEEVYVDKDLELASKGAALLVVHCRSDAAKRGAWRLIAPMEPLVARHYGIGGMDHLKGET